MADAQIADAVAQLTRVMAQVAVTQANQEQYLQRLQEPHVRLRVPEYEGDTEVELFLEQFHAVCAASGWNEQLALLKLRESLQGKARECGRADTVAGVEANLTLRFGTTPREARTKLEGLQRETKTTLADHGMLIEKLIRQSYPGLEEATLVSLGVEKFIASVNHLGLRNNLLARQPTSIADAIRAGNEYLQLNQKRAEPIRSLHVDGVDESVLANQQSPVPAKLESILAEVLAKLNQLLQVKPHQPRNWSHSTPASAPDHKKNRTSCFRCGRTGHWKSQCKVPAPQKSTN